MQRLTITAGFVDALRRQLGAGSAPVDLALGTRRAGGVVEFLAPPAVRPPVHGQPCLRVGRFPEHLRGATHLFWHAYPIVDEATPRVELALFDGGGCSAAVLVGGRAHALDAVHAVGPRMEVWQPGRLAPLAAAGDVPADGAFSRYAGALGGADVHARLRRLSVAIAGVSRLGSLLAVGFAKAGVSRLVLVDGDSLEVHHLDAADVDPDARLGDAKVHAVANLLARSAPDVAVDAIAAPLESEAALRALTTCDVLVTAPDRGQPRLLASLCAAAYLRVHLDVGTGVFHRDGRFDAGADVRLVLPGRHCLLCVGGVDLDARTEPDWRRQRAGSLRSLNGIAASFAMFQLERLVAGDVTATTWSRLRLDGAATMAVERPPFQARPGCPVCARTGTGDAIWRDRRDRLARMRTSDAVFPSTPRRP